MGQKKMPITALSVAYTNAMLSFPLTLFIKSDPHLYRKKHKI